MLFPKKNLLTDSEKQHIVAAIRAAEMKTSGEIRVHVEANIGQENPELRARQIFNELKMQDTENRNGTLIYVAVRDKKFAIVGDVGIHQAVGDAFWQMAALAMKAHFQQNNIAEGIATATRLVGEKLKKHFPYSANDKNELSDEISEA